MQQIHHKKNELFEVEFYKDKEYTQAFDFTNAKNLYIDGLNGDITPLYILKDKYYWRNIYTPYMSHKFSCEPCDNIITLNDITPNLSKYIPEDNAVLFLSEECYDKYRNFFSQRPCELLSKYILHSVNYTIFLHHGTQSELQKANEVEKELEEKYGVKEVNLFVLHWFYKNEDYDVISFLSYNEILNKIITTNSTGILKPQNYERLQVIDCKEIFEEYLKTER